MYIKQTADGYITTMPVQAAEWEGVLRSLELLGPDEEFPGLAETRQRIPEITAAYRGFTTAVLEERLLVRPHSSTHESWRLRFSVASYCSAVAVRLRQHCDGF